MLIDELKHAIDNNDINEFTRLVSENLEKIEDLRDEDGKTVVHLAIKCQHEKDRFNDAFILKLTELFSTQNDKFAKMFASEDNNGQTGLHLLAKTDYYPTYLKVKDLVGPELMQQLCFKLDSFGEVPVGLAYWGSRETNNDIAEMTYIDPKIPALGKTIDLAGALFTSEKPNKRLSRLLNVALDGINYVRSNIYYSCPHPTLNKDFIERNEHFEHVGKMRTKKDQTCPPYENAYDHISRISQLALDEHAGNCEEMCMVLAKYLHDRKISFSIQLVSFNEAKRKEGSGAFPAGNNHCLVLINNASYKSKITDDSILVDPWLGKIYLGKDYKEHLVSSYVGDEMRRNVCTVLPMQERLSVTPYLTIQSPPPNLKHRLHSSTSPSNDPVIKNAPVLTPVIKTKS